MKFKKLLIESEEENVAEELNRLLEGEYRNDIRLSNSTRYRRTNLLCRGTSTPVEFFDTRSIRKDRRPRDTPSLIDAIVSVFEDKFYPDFPKRSESKFATSYRSASGYGDHVVVVFPEEGADIISGSYDPTTNYFNNAFGSFQALDNKTYRFANAKWELKDDGLENLLRFFDMSGRFLREEIDYDEYEKYLQKNITEILSEEEVIRSDNHGLSEKLAGQIRRLFGNIRDYFGSMEKGLEGGKREIVFNGDSYLRINVQFFLDNFEWGGSKWVTQNQS